MADDPFNNLTIRTRIASGIARIQSAWLEWNAEPTEGKFDNKLVEMLVNALDVHADAYLEGVDHDSVISEYVRLLRWVGSIQIQNVEGGILADPNSEDQLRKRAQSSGVYMRRKRSLAPEEQEAEIREEVERLRLTAMPEALKWREHKNVILIRIETRFEARYRHWTAKAIERVQSRTLERRPAVNEFKAYKWEEVEISFFNEFSVQITVGPAKVVREFGSLGMAHKRSGKPTLAWQTLHDLALSKGVISHSTGTTRTWKTVEKRMQEIRSWLRARFGIPSDPVPFVNGTGYRAEFKISCAPSYQR